MSTDQGASAKADRAATPSEPSQSSVVSGVAGIPCAFTPGPWLFVEADPPTIEGNGETVVNLPLWQPAFQAERDANARLIAAAPELYEALSNFLERMANTPMNLDVAGWSEVAGPAIEALAKARGQ